ncbi:MAG: hypothetical protein COT67_02535 [Candidatus Tagabacteria bacterium CG09_land_8_20_14_0_10_41_14]|uniref:PilN domain-containing protein n=2 Tax=Candidatus Tagaibacteriota TaxID=1817918 RepID=A0A2H0WKV5_9BACT|nr:MAG: hypothetical protein COT67_02535 [Candidatus Tagabacteria bacterium CG09_land_8_20_14_0_10_41_14]PJE73328.1 MAG: hypothetical protein COV00_00450 [Candidatus Tagabacteria bacterium CG10_big_fil_rev_8_21_14_0_10_40_13]
MPNILSKTPFIPESDFIASGVSYREAGWGLLFKVVVFLLVISLASFGGSLFYKRVLTQQIDELYFSLERAKASFDPILIAEMEDLSKSVPIVEDLIEAHHHPAKIFEFLEDLSSQDIRFTKFSYNFKEDVRPSSSLAPQVQVVVENPVSVSLDGEARSFTVLAEQAEIFSANSDINSFSFSNFSLTRDGNVSFSLEVVLNSAIFKI